MSARSASERISFGYGGIWPLELRTKTLNASNGIGLGASGFPAGPPRPGSPGHCPPPVFIKGALPRAAAAGSRGSRNQPEEGKRDQPQAHGFRPQRGWVQTLTSAGAPDCTTLTASRSADASCEASLIGPLAHQPIDSASL